MTDALRQLLAYQHAPDCFDVPIDQVRPLQIAAMDERLQDRRGRIKLLKLRADDAGIEAIRGLADVVPLLLPHTAYKSYPESFLLEEKWERLTKWLATVSTYPLDDVALDGVTGIDDWVSRLAAVGHPVSCSSGTTGKSAMLIGSHADLDFAAANAVVGCAWATGMPPARDRHMFSLAPVADIPRNHAIQAGLYAAYGKPDVPMFRYPVPPITVGAITRMVALRRAIADGSARPTDLAEFEATSAERQAAMDGAVDIAVEALLAARHEKLFLVGMWAPIYKIAEALRARGVSGQDFHPDNMMYVGGGLKGNVLPGDYREVVFETFNIAPDRNFLIYGMQELGSTMPRCGAGRYHLTPWQVCLPLNRDGDALLPLGEGEIEGRAAFFDLSIDGRWGGVISGDRISADFGPCDCGARSPSIRDDIVRYSDLTGDDKIGCAGTIDAYVRGLT